MFDDASTVVINGKEVDLIIGETYNCSAPDCYDASFTAIAIPEGYSSMRERFTKQGRTKPYTLETSLVPVY